VWAATNRSLYTSSDGGATWDSVAVVDPDTGERLRGPFVGIESVDLGDGELSLWAGAENGLARSTDGGASWRILVFPPRTRSLDEGEIIGEGGLVEADSLRTYAAPNPFSPARDESCRIVFSLSAEAAVSLDIFDFASRPVAQLLDGSRRPGQENHWYLWDGRDGDGQVVANGVYFYRLETDRGQAAFGKIVVLD
jgi:hypothetical protein